MSTFTYFVVYWFEYFSKQTIHLRSIRIVPECSLIKASDYTLALVIIRQRTPPVYIPLQYYNGLHTDNDPLPYT